ncbi:MAG: class I SAM-dependent methyltransferase [Herpetosiphon sp.]
MIDHNNLEEFADPESYDCEDSSDTGSAFYSDLARETGGPVLEIACGTGRVAIPIARLGFAVTGLDIVPGMVALARSKSAGLPTRWIEGDARTFELGEQFRLIFLTGNAFQAFLTNADQAALLKRVRVHLADDGLFAFETRNPRWATRTRADQEAPEEMARRQDQGLFALLETRTEEEDGQGYIDHRGRAIRVSRTQVYDHVAQILHWTTFRRHGEGHQEEMTTTRIAVRFTFPQELAALLHFHGFTVVRQYGDWNLEPLNATSPSIIVVCRKRD